MILVLGDGVGARIAHHFLEEAGIQHRIVVSEAVPKTNNLSGGVRYLEPPMINQLVYAEMLGDYEVAGMSGGVIADKEIFPWETIFAEPAYQHYLSGMYSIDKKRPWSTQILNRMCERTEAPGYVSNVPYAEFLDNLRPFEDADQVKITSLASIDTEAKEVLCHSFGAIIALKYDGIISTVPANVLNQLVGLKPISLSFSENLEFSQKLTIDNRDQMWYIMRHGPIKRISVVDNVVKIEMKDDGVDPKKMLTDCMMQNHLLDLMSAIVNSEIMLGVDNWTINKLPPNFSVDDPDEKAEMFKQLYNTNIYPLGRFAQLNPKTIVPDMVEESAAIVSALLNTA